MRTINDLIIHCTATFPGQRVTLADITRWHQQSGWRTIGYHYVIMPDGKVETGRPESEIGAHCQGHNANAIGICYVGGLDKDGNHADTRTEAQKAALRKLLQELLTRYPHAQIHGHKDYRPTACPCFDAHSEYAHLIPMQ